VRRSGPPIESGESALEAKSEDVLSQAMPASLTVLVRIGNTAAIFPGFKTWKRYLESGAFPDGVLAQALS
jgi:hypothetical protein